MNNIRSE